MFRWCSLRPSSILYTTADANGLCELILIWSVISDAQHELGYVRFGFAEKSYKSDAMEERKRKNVMKRYKDKSHVTCKNKV